MRSLRVCHGVFPRITSFALGLLALSFILGTPAFTHAAVQLKQNAGQPLSVQSAPLPLAAPCVSFDFDALPAGTILTQQGDVTFTVQQGVAGKVVLYPTNNSNWPETDLDVEHVGNVIVFPEVITVNSQGLANPVGDNASGGKLLVTFGAPRLIKTVTFADDEQDGAATVELFCANGSLGKYSSPKTGGGVAMTQSVKVDKVTSLVWTTNATINFKFSSACSAVAVPTNTPAALPTNTPLVLIGGDSGIILPTTTPTVPPTGTPLVLVAGSTAVPQANTPAAVPTNTPVVVPNAVPLNPGAFVFVMGANCTLQSTLVDAFTKSFVCGTGTPPSTLPSQANWIYLPPNGSVAIQGNGCTLSVEQEPNANIYYLECSAAIAPTNTPLVTPTNTPLVAPPATPLLTPTNTPTPAPTADNTARLEDYIARAIARSNQYRQQNGCHVPLVENSLLDRAAQKHADWMAGHTYLSHFEPPPDNNNPPDQRMQAEGYPTASGTAENVQTGPYSPEDAVDVWYNDPSHRQAILDCSFVAIGIGYGENLDTFWTYWWTMDLGADSTGNIVAGQPTLTPLPTRTVDTFACTPPDFDWVDSINALRSASGLPTVTESADMTLAACFHSRYMLKNDMKTQIEDTNNPWYTQQGDAAGRSGDPFTDTIQNSNDKSVLNRWLGGANRLLALLDPKLTRVGFAIVRDSSGDVKTAATLYLNSGPVPNVSYPVYYPPNGGQEPFIQYDGNESPNVLDTCQNYTVPSGPPIILLVSGSNATPNASASSLTNGANALAHCYSLKSSPVGSVMILPKAPLQQGSTYNVAVTVNGKQYNWSFRVGDTAGGAPTNAPLPTDTAVPTITPTVETTNTPVGAPTSAPTNTPTPTSSSLSLSPDAANALAYLNGIRQQMGLSPVSVDPALSADAAKHAHYIVLNDVDLSQTGDYHSEDSSKPGYTPEGEAVAGNSDIDPTCYFNWEGPMHNWLRAPLHAIGLLDPSLDSIGMGDDAAGPFKPPCAYVLGFHFRWPPVGPYPIYYPPPNGTHQFLAWDKAEGDALFQFAKNCTGKEAGAAIFLQDAANIQLSDVTSASFAQGDTATNGNSCVGVYFNWIYLIPPATLTSGSKYTVSITSHGKPYTWSFEAP